VARRCERACGRFRSQDPFPGWTKPRARTHPESHLGKPSPARRATSSSTIISEPTAHEVREFARNHLMPDPFADVERNYSYDIYSVYLDSPAWP